MINANLEQFLDTGWYMESEIYYNGYIYWCEGQYNFKTKIWHFFVQRWKVKTDDFVTYHEYRKDGDLVDFSIAYEFFHEDLDYIKKMFLEAPIFEGKSFWEVENELAWLDEDTPIYLD